MIKTEKTEKFFKGCRVFGYKFEKGISGQEAIYFNDGTMITNRIEKVILLRYHRIITSNIEEVDGWYKFKVKKLYQLSEDQRELISFHMSKIMWKYGNAPLQQIQDIRKYLESVKEDEVVVVLRKLVSSAEEIGKKFISSSSDIFIDINDDNWMSDGGKLVNPDGIWMKLAEEDKHRFKEIFF